MAVDSLGPKRQPQFLDGGSPDIAVDPTAVADYAAYVGNRIVDTAAARLAASSWAWEGLQWGDTTDGNDYRWDGSAWEILHSDTGWVNVPLGAGLTGSARYRVVGKDVEIRFDISGTLSSSTFLTEPLPDEFVPTGVPELYALPAYVNDLAAGTTVYMSVASKVLRIIGVGTRVRGGGRWFLG